MNEKILQGDFPGMQALVNEVLIPVLRPDDFDIEDYIDITEDYADKAKNAHIQEVRRYTQSISFGVYALEFYEIILEDRCDIRHARVGIQSIIRSEMQSYSNALIVFHYATPDNRTWRLSYVNKGKSQADSTSAKRYTYLLGKNYTSRTFIERLRVLQKTTCIDEEALLNAFSVEALTKEFYQKLFNWYLWAKDKKTGVTFPNSPDTEADDRDKIEIKMIRLVTRMLFVWFIKQKQLVPNNLFNEKELHSILRNFDSQSAKQGNYYNAILQNLFFATLNQEIKHRAFSEAPSKGESSTYTIKSLYRDSQSQSWFNFPEKNRQQQIMDLFCEIPYLNGGLFDCLDKYENIDGKIKPIFYYDGFSSQDTLSPNGNLKYRAFIPNNLFFADEHEEIVTDNGSQQKVMVMGLIRIFEQYNFTIEENSPTDTEISLDPELLGHVFENLLASYNEETQKTARKSTGSFYTPREIVNYMVNEAIISYLLQKKYDETAIRLLVEQGDASAIDCPEKLISDIKAMTVLDPACGSGAFPMGFLLRMTELIELLSVNDFDKYQTKLDIIRHCIYGVDIQPIAMLICKLRFFISLICDSEKDPNKENFGITPLPSLETKFVAANTLRSADVKSFDSDWSKDENLTQLKEKLLALRTNVINVRTFNEKWENIRKDDEICREIEQYIIQHSSKPNEDKINCLKREIEKCKQEMACYTGECWVEDTVAQTSLFETTSPTLFRHDINKEKREHLKVQIKQCEADIQREQEKSITKGFEAAVEQVTTKWNPHNQNAEASFFDPEWMFGITNGFDVVIGNPPYVSTKGTTTDKKIYEHEFGFSDDLYNLFTFKGLSLTKQGGTLTYIMPKTFWTTQTKRNMRDLLLSKNIRYIFDTANPFESVMVDTCILQVINTPFEPTHEIHFLDGSKDLKNPIVFAPIKQSVYIETQNAVIFKPTEFNMKVWGQFNQKVKALYDKWWDKIKTSRDIEKNKASLEEYRSSLKPGDVALLGCLTEGGQGLATANNGKYIAIRKSSKWADNVYASRPKKLSEALSKYPKIADYIGHLTPDQFIKQSTEPEIADTFDSIKEHFGRDVFGQGYLYKLIDDCEIADVDSLTEDEKQNGIDTSKPYYVPYDKGDKDGNRWYLETPFAIAWSKENVHFLKTDPKARYQGYSFFFKEGFCWTDINSTFLKARLKSKGVFDVVSMSLFTQTSLPDWFYVCLINTNLMSFYVDNFINNTSHFQINDARQTPIVIPTLEQIENFESIYNRAYDAQTNDSISETERYNLLQSIQSDLDNVVRKLYGISML